MSSKRVLWIVGDALELLQNVERMQRRFVAADAAQPVPCWEPPVDLYEQGDELRLLVALPGVDFGQLEVVLEGGTVMVRGKRPMHPASQRAAIYRLEIPYGSFERRIALPPGNFTVQQQFLEDGCLVLVLRHLC
jgi:HSP20 family molecular chaperone IbpA